MESTDCFPLSLRRKKWDYSNYSSWLWGSLWTPSQSLSAKDSQCAGGYFLGVQFREKITAVDHWIAFILLGLIGANMIKEACSGDCEEENDSLDIRTMFLLAVATSIDALAVGITFAFLNVHLLSAVSFIGATTFILSAIGVRIGNVFGTRYKAKAEFAGGAILILLGLKILLEHLGVLAF